MRIKVIVFHKKILNGYFKLMNEIKFGECYFLIPRVRRVGDDYLFESILTGLPINVISNSFNYIIRFFAN